MTRLRRVFHADIDGSAAEIELDPDETRHVVRVLRLEPGDTLGVFDGRGREWTAVLDAVHGRRARVRVQQEIGGTVDPALRVVLYQGRCRPDRMEWLIQKATEVGVAAVRVLPTARVEGPAPGPRRLERWRRIAVEACKQSGRRRVPDVELADGLPGGVPAGVCAVVLDGGAGTPPMARVLGGARSGRVRIAVGPEGGWAADEAAALEGAGWRPASLGPRTLRTETAGVAAATLVLHAWGDLGSDAASD